MKKFLISVTVISIGVSWLNSSAQATGCFRLDEFRDALERSGKLGTCAKVLVDFRGPQVGVDEIREMYCRRTNQNRAGDWKSTGISGLCGYLTGGGIGEVRQGGDVVEIEGGFGSAEGGGRTNKFYISRCTQDSLELTTSMARGVKIEFKRVADDTLLITQRNVNLTSGDRTFSGNTEVTAIRFGMSEGKGFAYARNPEFSEALAGHRCPEVPRPKTSSGPSPRVSPSPAPMRMKSRTSTGTSTSTSTDSDKSADQAE